MPTWIALLYQIWGVVVASGSYFTHDFAVELRSDQDPNEIAHAHACVNLGEFLPGIFHFKHQKVHRRSAFESNIPKFYNDDRILSAVQQKTRNRVKRDFIEEKRAPKDPLYPRMFYLDPNYPGRQSDDDIRHMNITGAWAQGVSGRGVVVTILDDGIEKEHSDLKRNYDPEASYDINGNDDDPTPTYNPSNDKINFKLDSSYRSTNAPIDKDGNMIKLTENVRDYQKEINRHGTRCAGEVAAAADNNVCVPGIAFNAKIGGIRMLDGDVTDMVESKSIGWRPNHVDIYSASWGPDDDGKTVDGPAKLAQLAFQRGAEDGRRGLGSIFVWASGNGGRFSDNCNCDGYTNSIYTISISSTSENEEIPWYSEFCASTLASTYSSGSTNERQIVTTDLRGICTEHHTGTSASAPIAAAILALALEANPNLNWRDMQHLLVRTSRKRLLKSTDWQINSLGRDYSHRYGYGLIDAGALVELAKIWNSVPPQRNYTHIFLDAAQKDQQAIKFADKFKDNIIKISIPVNFNSFNIDKLEHVTFVASIKFKNRGNLRIRITSPHETESTILDKRPHDASSKGFDKFEFLSVHFWDESPFGEWQLKIENLGEEKDNWGSLDYFAIKFMGNGYDQLDIKCPDQLIYDLSSGICLEQCPKGSFKKLVTPIRQPIIPPPVKRDEDSKFDYQCHRCPKNCLVCTDFQNCLQKRDRTNRNGADQSATALTPDHNLASYPTDQIYPNSVGHRAALSCLMVAVGVSTLIFLHKKCKSKKTIIYTPLPNS